MKNKSFHFSGVMCHMSPVTSATCLSYYITYVSKDCFYVEAFRGLLLGEHDGTTDKIQQPHNRPTDFVTYRLHRRLADSEKIN